MMHNPVRTVGTNERTPKTLKTVFFSPPQANFFLDVFQPAAGEKKLGCFPPPQEIWKLQTKGNTTGNRKAPEKKNYSLGGEEPRRLGLSELDHAVLDGRLETQSSLEEGPELKLWVDCV